MRYLSILLFIAISCSSPGKKEREKKQAWNGRVQLSYDLEGSGDTLLMLVHGWAINKTYWKDQLDTFSKRFTVAAIDLGGHGESGKNRTSFTVDDYAADVLAVINAIEADKIILAGHSMSGDIVLNVANRLPGKVVGIVGIDNFKNVTTSYSEKEKADIDSFKISLHKNYKAVITSWVYNGLFPKGYTDSIIMKKLLSDVLATDSTVSIKTIESMISTELSMGGRLNKLSIPLHVITSSYAPVNIATLSKYCKAGFREKVIVGTGHYPMIERPGEFNRLMFEIINEIAKGE